MASEDRPQQVRLGTALEARIQGLRHSFSEKELSVANFLTTDPRGFISLSISALAKRCGISETVIIRFYRKLGYAGFHAFKIDVATSLTETSETAGVVDLKTGDDVETIKRKVLAITRQALEDAAAAIDSEQLTLARDALLKARRVVVAAFGGSASVGLDLQHKLLKLGIIATLLSDSHMQAMAAEVLGPGDVLLAISHSGNSRDVIESLQQARQHGARTIVITGFPFSPATRQADICLFTPCRETKYQTDAMTSRIVQLAVVDTLYVASLFTNRALQASVKATSVAAAGKKL